MTLFHVEYRYGGDPAERDRLRPSHREFLGQAHAAGSVLLVGPYGDDGPPGALVIVDAPDAAAALALLDPDPFYTAGLIAERRVRPWTQVYGPFSGS